MKILLQCLATLLLAMCLVACSSISDDITYDLETYVWLEREGIWDPEVPTRTVQKLLRKGLYHEDPEIFRCSIGAIVVRGGQMNHDRLVGRTSRIDRRLNKLPGIYKLLTGMWEDGWEESGGSVPEEQRFDDFYDRVINKTGCLFAPDPMWTALALPLVNLFPEDEKIHEIIWKDLPQRNPDEMLEALFSGRFNNRIDQKYRINVLTNPNTDISQARLAAKSLGEFHAEGGLEALAKVLQEDIFPYTPPQVTIVDAMIKYEAKAVPYIDLMRKSLRSAGTTSEEDGELKRAVLERFTQFEKDYAHALDKTNG